MSALIFSTPLRMTPAAISTTAPSSSVVQTALVSPASEPKFGIASYTVQVSSISSLGPWTTVATGLAAGAFPYNWNTAVPGTAYYVQVLARSNKPAYAVASNVSSVTTPAGPGSSMLAWFTSIKGLKCVAMVTPDPYSATPLGSINFGTGGSNSTSTASYAGGTVKVGTPNYPGAGGPATNEGPGGVQYYVIAPPSANTHWFLNTISNAPPNDWKSLSLAAQSVRQIVDLVLLLSCPTPGQNPFTTNGGVLNIGSVAYNQLIANLTTILPDVKAVTDNYPSLIALQGELNLGGGGFNDPQCWFASNVCTSTQAAEVFHIVKTFFVSNGVVARWAFQFNLGVGNYLFGFPGPQIAGGTWSHGPSDADFIFFDSVPMYFDSGALTAMNSTGLLQGYGSAIPEQQNQSTCNLYTGAGMGVTNGAQGIGFQQVLLDYPNIVLYILWGQYYGTQSAAWNFQLGSAQTLAGQFVGQSLMPLLSSI